MLKLEYYDFLSSSLNMHCFLHPDENTVQDIAEETSKNDTHLTMTDFSNKGWRRNLMKSTLLKNTRSSSPVI